MSITCKLQEHWQTILVSNDVNGFFFFANMDQNLLVLDTALDALHVWSYLIPKPSN